MIKNTQITEKKWEAKKSPNPEIVKSLKEALNVKEWLAILIAQRGITTFDEAKNYFNPTHQKTHDPFLMKGMDKVASRLENAINSKENILIYGDYDVDGTTSVALVYRYLKSLTSNLFWYVPDRFNEGYGISKEGIDYAIENKVSLMIALDCGIKEIEMAKYAKSNQIDLVICDHHTPGDQLPDAFAILNPKQTDCPYPYKELSGCGIGFKLIQGHHQQFTSGRDPFELIDLVAVSIASDIVPITGENRILAARGLNKINENALIPFKALLQNLQLDKKLNITDLVFIIGPRLNASGRMEHARKTVEYLISDTPNNAAKALLGIDQRNNKRKKLDEDIAIQALDIINASDELKNRKTTVLYNDNWHKGVIGIVASRLTEFFYRPTIILSNNNGILSGSARSVKGFNIYEAISSCADLLDQFGGHQYAAGLSLKKENFEKFSRKFEQVVAETITEEQLTPVIEYDLELDVNSINMSLAQTIERFAPFGPGNMRPVFMSRNLEKKYEPRIVGDNHLKLTIKTKEGYIDAIAFNMGTHLEDIKSGKPFHLCYTIDQNKWKEKIQLQLKIKDIKYES